MSKKFYPVIHCVDPYKKGGIGHALANMKIARDNGADGVFLIGHRMLWLDLCHIYQRVRKQHPDFWIGANFLDLNPNVPVMFADAVGQHCPGLNGYWTDRSPVVRPDIPQQVFAGVAFKYIDPHQSGEALDTACTQIITFADVATTSGDMTGSPPTLAKLEKIKACLRGCVPLAVASGVSTENVHPMKAHADIFLVASSIITKDPSRGNAEYFVPEKVRELSDVIHS